MSQVTKAVLVEVFSTLSLLILNVVIVPPPPPPPPLKGAGLGVGVGVGGVEVAGGVTTGGVEVAGGGVTTGGITGAFVTVTELLQLAEEPPDAMDTEAVLIPVVVYALLTDPEAPANASVPDHEKVYEPVPPDTLDDQVTVPPTVGVVVLTEHDTERDCALTVLINKVSTNGMNINNPCKNNPIIKQAIIAPKLALIFFIIF